MVFVREQNLRLSLISSYSLWSTHSLFQVLVGSCSCVSFVQCMTPMAELIQNYWVASEHFDCIVRSTLDSTVFTGCVCVQCDILRHMEGLAYSALSYLGFVVSCRVEKTSVHTLCETLNCNLTCWDEILRSRTRRNYLGSYCGCFPTDPWGDNWPDWRHILYSSIAFAK